MPAVRERALSDLALAGTIAHYSQRNYDLKFLNGLTTSLSWLPATLCMYRHVNSSNIFPPLLELFLVFLWSSKDKVRFSFLFPPTALMLLIARVWGFLGLSGTGLSFSNTRYQIYFGSSECQYRSTENNRLQASDRHINGSKKATITVTFIMWHAVERRDTRTEGSILGRGCPFGNETA